MTSKLHQIADKYPTKRAKIPVAQVKPNPWNPNRCDDATMARLMESFRRFGSLAPIVVRRRKVGFQVLDGEHRLQVHRLVGEPKIEAVILPRNLPDHEAKLVTLALNEVHGENDTELLNELLSELVGSLSEEEVEEVIPLQDLRGVVDSVLDHDFGSEDLDDHSDALADTSMDEKLGKYSGEEHSEEDGEDPDDLVEEEAHDEDEERTLTFTLSNELAGLVDKAMLVAKRKALKRGERLTRAECLAYVCGVFVRSA